MSDKVTKEEMLSAIDAMECEFLESEAYPGAGRPFEGDHSGYAAFKTTVHAIRALIENSDKDGPGKVVADDRRGHSDAPVGPSPGSLSPTPRAIDEALEELKANAVFANSKAAERFMTAFRTLRAATKPKVVEAKDIEKLMIRLIDCGPLWYRGEMPEEGRAVSIVSGWLRDLGITVKEEQP